MWTTIHDFVHGWGYRHSDGRVIWCDAVEHFLGSGVIADGQHEEAYARLQPLLAAERTKIPPVTVGTFDKFVFPNVKQPFPDIEELR